MWLKINNAHIGAGGVGNRMPPAPIPMIQQSDLDLIETWILEGAPE